MQPTRLSFVCHFKMANATGMLRVNRVELSRQEMMRIIIIIIIINLLLLLLMLLESSTEKISAGKRW